MDKAGAEIIVEGRVQGVFYRAFTEAAANELGLSGYCRNLDDGSVLVKAEGDRTLIEKLIRKLWVGPPPAHVVDIRVHWGPWEGTHHGFKTRI